MRPWLRGILMVAMLAGVLLASSFSSRAPTIPEIGKRQAPPLMRRGTTNLDVSAEAVFIVRLATGEILFERNADTRLPIASLTKLMTSLLLAEEDSLAEIEFTAGAKGVGDADDKRSTARAGERIRAEDVLKLLLVSSDNDAAYAAAEHLARRDRPEPDENEKASSQERIAAFVDTMNRRAAALGLEHTHFANPAGSDDPENYSTARDLVRLAEAIRQSHPELWAASRLREAFAFGQSGRRHSIVNTNPLIGEFPAIYGSKTGFEDAARGALIILYRLRREEVVAIVLLRSRDRFGDGRAAIRWLEENFVVESP